LSALAGSHHTPQAKSALRPAITPQDLSPHYRRVKVIHRHRHYIGPVEHGIATYYSGGCDPTGGGSTTSSGSGTFFGEVAETSYPLGTKIEVRPRLKGKRDFVILDRFGSAQATGRLDVYLEGCPAWNNPQVSWRAYRERVVIFHRRMLVP